MRLAKMALGCAAALCPLLAQDPLLDWMNRVAQEQLTKRDAAMAAIRTPADAKRRSEWVRSKLLDIMGGLPDYHGPLNARVTGRLTNDQYTMEKVIFESLPRYYVTADLYRPNQPGRYPAVLMSAGHNRLGKVENHRMAANLAAKGFVALAYDPMGLGERVQAYDPRKGEGSAGCCCNEHMHAGAQSMLIGQSVARYFTWDAMRGVDYLLSRPDVDGNRIAAAGCSGGGCITTYVGALDPRVKAAAPACFLNSLRLLFAGPYPGPEMSLPGFLASGLDHADFVEVSGGKPWLILTTEGDFFTPAGVIPVYEEARRWYRLLGAEEKVRTFTGPGPHGTPLETRETLYAWMIEWLRPGEKVDAREHDVPLYSDNDLQVTKAGQVEYEEGSRWLYQVIREEFHALRQPRGIPELLAELRKLQIPSGRRPPAHRMVEQKPGRMAVTLEGDTGVEIGGTLYLPGTPGRRPAVLLVKDKTTAPLAEAAAAKGFVVLELEPRDSSSGYDKREFLGNWMTNTRADSIGRNLAAMRAHDLLQGLDFLAGRNDVDASRIRAAARDVKGVWLLLAAAADSRIRKVWLDRTPHALSDAMDRAINTNLYDAAIPGFLLHWDLADLVRAMGNRTVLWTDPANWMGKTVPSLGRGFSYRNPGQKEDAFLETFLQ